MRLLGRDRMRSLAHKQAQSQGHLLNPLWLSHINECYLSVKTNQLLLKKQSVHLKKFKLKKSRRRKGKEGKKARSVDGQTDRYSPLQWTHYSPGPTSPAAWASACFCGHKKDRQGKWGLKNRMSYITCFHRWGESRNLKKKKKKRRHKSNQDYKQGEPRASKSKAKKRLSVNFYVLDSAHALRLCCLHCILWGNKYLSELRRDRNMLWIMENVTYARPKPCSRIFSSHSGHSLTFSATL